MQLSLMNIKKYYLKRKQQGTNWKELKTKNKVGTYEVNKKSLSYFDDKRFTLDDGVHTIAYFHKDIPV